MKSEEGIAHAVGRVHRSRILMLRYLVCFGSFFTLKQLVWVGTQFFSVSPDPFCALSRLGLYEWTKWRDRTNWNHDFRTVESHSRTKMFRAIHLGSSEYAAPASLALVAFGFPCKKRKTRCHNDIGFFICNLSTISKHVAETI